METIFQNQNCTGFESSFDTSVAGENVKPALVGCVYVRRASRYY